MRIAFVTPRVPYPLDSGGRIRTFELLKAVSQVHRVTLVTAVEGQTDDGALIALRERIHRLRARVVRVPQRTAPLPKLSRMLRSPVDPLPYTWAGYRHPRFIANVRSALDETQYDLVHCEQPHVAHTLMALETPPRILSSQNVETLIVRRFAETESCLWRKVLVAWQARKTLEAERRTYLSFNHCAAVSDEDRAEMERIAPGVPVTVVPNGVDVDWFAPTATIIDRHLLVFTGAMDWLPNIDGITFFVTEVLPRIHARMPGVELLVVGRNPSESMVRQLAGNGVRFSGTVPDTRPYLSRAGLVVVPLRIGSGTRLKILEAWALGKPVLSTSIGAEGLPALDGENIAIADTPEDMALRTVTLLHDVDSSDRLGAAGRQLVEERFAWKTVADALLGAYEETLSTARRHPRRGR